MQGQHLTKDELNRTESNDFIPSTHHFYRDPNDPMPNAPHDEGDIPSENMIGEAPHILRTPPCRTIRTTP